MSTTTDNNSRKWIQASVAILCGIIAYVMMSFFDQIGEWFELEAKLSSYGVVAQVLGVLVGLGTFIYIMSNKKTSDFLKDVYQEVLKVVWPGKEDTNRMTVIIMILVTIIGFILGFFDTAATWLLSLVTK